MDCTGPTSQGGECPGRWLSLPDRFRTIPVRNDSRAKQPVLFAMSLLTLRGLKQMNGIPPLQNASTSESPDTHSEECPICIEKYGSWTVTIECGHKFCGYCFVRLIIHNSEKCPMCRGPLLTRIITPRPTNPEPNLMSAHDSCIEPMGHRSNADIPPGHF